MANKKPIPKKKKKKHTFQFTFNSLFLLSLGSFFILIWVFFLGILVGRGLLPHSIENFPFIKKKIVIDEAIKKKDHVNPIKIDELSFYNQLIDKKEKAKKKIPPATVLKDHRKKKGKTKITHAQQDVRRYSVQVAALKDKADSEKMVTRLKGLGYQAYYYQILTNGEIFYRVRCGPFSNIEKAKKYAKRLADKDGFKPFIVYPDNQ